VYFGAEMRAKIHTYADYEACDEVRYEASYNGSYEARYGALCQARRHALYGVL
jgi:hypothetical protein